jgi:hypothetical protein
VVFAASIRGNRSCFGVTILGHERGFGISISRTSNHFVIKPLLHLKLLVLGGGHDLLDLVDSVVMIYQRQICGSIAMLRISFVCSFFASFSKIGVLSSVTRFWAGLAQLLIVVPACSS